MPLIRSLFFVAWFLAAIWAASEILFLSHVLLTEGSLVFQRGLFVTRRISFHTIIRLNTKEEKIEYSALTSWQNSLLYSGEKLRISTEGHEVVIHSIWLKDNLTFRNKLRQLAVNTTVHCSGKFNERTSHFALLISGLFILVMSYVNLFGK
ncbi:hypothetical protein [Hymenobacter sp. DG25A]|uniref:hypothetical protein n=1 Tax=Hymenobacter sp. DG25A TaxID=1385663 RepID=UPI0006BC6B26|nr:hypothetical protein [Hymenobacter sp. DG25A]ALD21148.1 hypothetical protein AM218_07890 [Hymenobacter sp. DG25A]